MQAPYDRSSRSSQARCTISNFPRQPWRSPNGEKGGQASYRMRSPGAQNDGGAVEREVRPADAGRSAMASAERPCGEPTETLEPTAASWARPRAFAVLGEPRSRRGTVGGALGATVVALIGPGGVALLPPARTWVRDQPQRRLAVQEGLGASLAGTRLKVPSPDPLRHYARAVAGPAGVELVPEHGRPVDHSVRSPRSAGSPAWIEEIVYLPEQHPPTRSQR